MDTQTARVDALFQASLATISNAAQTLGQPIARAGESLISCLDLGGKVLLCGNGGSSSDATHFSAELLNRFETERRPLPAIALTTDTATLTAIANDYDYSQVFAKQITALGNPGDALIAISTSGNSPTILNAIDRAHDNQMRCIGLTGNEGGKMSLHLNSDDINIIVPSTSTARIQEVHGIVVHCLCDLIDQHFTR
jgi:D-sedoheptulose 7-phosphate isomerase